MFCAYCGQKLHENNRFCGHCGMPVNLNESAAPRTPAQDGRAGLPRKKNSKKRIRWIRIAAPAAALLSIVFLCAFRPSADAAAQPGPQETPAHTQEAPANTQEAPALSQPPSDVSGPEEPSDCGTQLYAAAINRVQDVARHDSGEGFLFDLDGDGTEELFLTYAMYAPGGNGHDAPFTACSVYTIRDGAPAALQEDLLLQERAGADRVNVGVYRIGGEVRFCTHIYSAGDRSSVHRWDIYSYEDGTLRRTSEVRAFEAADPANSYAEIDGERQSCDAYARWAEDVVTVREMTGHVGNPDDSGLVLAELLSSLGSAPAAGDV